MKGNTVALMATLPGWRKARATSRRFGEKSPIRHKLNGLLYGTALAILGLIFVSPRLMWAQTLKQGAHLLDSLQELPVGLGTPPKLAIPADNRQNAGKVELGRKLFFNKNLSGDRSMSCATCHDPAKGFSDGKPLAVGFQGKELGRHTPTLWNVAYNTYQYWDGRALSLEQQASGPITAVEEMNLPDEAKLVSRLNADPRYRQEFQAVFSEGPSLNSVAKAIAAFERTITTTNSRFDRYAAGDKDALTLHEKNGLVLFIGKARCSRCHDGPNLTDHKFQNIGVGVNNEGRFAVTRQENDRGAFKTPGLFNVDLHAPYMHDGSLSTLEAVIDYYDRGGNAQKGKSPFILKIDLTANEKQDLLAFLKSLNGSVAVATLAPHRANIEGHPSSKKPKHWQN